MSRWRCACCLALALATPAVADHARVLLDGSTLGRLPLKSGFLLPDGTVMTTESLVRACRGRKIAGLLHYRPDTDSCRPARELGPLELPDILPGAGEVLVFNLQTRQTCQPGRCQVVYGGAGGSLDGGGKPTVPEVAIDSFTASPDALTGTGTTTLSWATSEADSCTLAGDPGFPPATVPVTGSTDRIIEVTTEFTLECVNAASWASASLTVAVTVPPDPVSIDVFEASPDALVGSGQVTLSWSASHAEECMLADDQGTEPEAVAVSGSVERQVESTTVFSLDCSNASSIDEATATVTVTDPLPDPVSIDSFSADPESLVGEGIVTLTWQSSHADTCTLNDNHGTGPEPVPTTGSDEKLVAVTTQFTLSCINASSTDLENLTVTVTNEPEDPVDPDDAVFADRFEPGAD